MIRTFHFSAKSPDFSCFEYEDNSLLFASEKLPTMSVSVNTPSVPPFDTHLLAYQLVHIYIHFPYTCVHITHHPYLSLSSVQWRDGYELEQPRHL